MTRKRQGGRTNSNMTRLVLDTYGRICMLRLGGCTGVATTKDHIVPYAAGGTDTLDNFRPACRSCNSRRQDRAMAGAGARVVVVIGPPAAGKSTHITENARPEDVVIDLDAMARSIMAVQPKHTHTYPSWVRHVAIGMRKAAIDRATRLNESITVWLIHSTPTAEQLATYRGNRWPVVVIDPGRELVMQRCVSMRPPEVREAVARWYDVTLAAAVPATAKPAGLQLDKAPIAGVQPSRSW